MLVASAAAQAGDGAPRQVFHHQSV